MSAPIPIVPITQAEARRAVENTLAREDLILLLYKICSIAEEDLRSMHGDPIFRYPTPQELFAIAAGELTP